MTSTLDTDTFPALFAKTVVAGIDAGGTKIDVVFFDTKTGITIFAQRYDTSDYSSLKNVVLRSMIEAGVRPAKVVIAAAGLPQEDGSVVMTNCAHWGVFDPHEITSLTDTVVEVVNDMIGTVAGLPVLGRDDVEVLYAGEPDEKGNKDLSTVSTGIGSASLLGGSEAGHSTWQPQSTYEFRYLQFLQDGLGNNNVSVEQATSGKYGFDAAYDFVASRGGVIPSRLVAAAVKMARRHDEGIGALITAGALDGDPFCAEVMDLIGSIFGQYARNRALHTLPTGGMYFVGSVMQAPGVARYLLEQTPFMERFVAPGAMHDKFMRRLPLYLVTDPKVAVKGALELAKR